MTRNASILGVLLALLITTIATPASVGLASAASPPTDPMASPAADEPIHIQYAVQLHPDNHSRLKVRVTVTPPDSLAEFRFTTQPNDFTVIESDGFTHQSNGEFLWKAGETTPPTLTYSVPRNQTGKFNEYGSAGTGDWAFINSHHIDMRFTYRYYGSDPGYVEDITPVANGYGGVSLAVLDEYKVYGNESGGVRVIVPEAATLQTDPEEALNALHSSQEMLTVGGEDRVVNVFVAPDPVRGGGLAPGTERDGIQDVWVHEGSSLNTTHNTWIHEYVHTRQSFDRADDMDWFLEGGADYYAALLALHQNRVGFDSFHARMTPEMDDPAVLADKSTWDGAPYKQGRRTLAALDAEIRRSTNNNRSLMDVFARMNAQSGEVSREEFKQFVVDVSDNESLAGWVDRYTTDAAVPTPPDDPSLYVQTTAPRDSDNDGLLDAHEFELGTNPFDNQSDGDGISDGVEVETYGTDPLTPDSDADALQDDEELWLGTDPLTPSSVEEITLRWVQG